MRRVRGGVECGKVSREKRVRRKVEIQMAGFGEYATDTTKTRNLEAMLQPDSRSAHQKHTLSSTYERLHDPKKRYAHGFLKVDHGALRLHHDVGGEHRRVPQDMGDGRRGGPRESGVRHVARARLAQAEGHVEGVQHRTNEEGDGDAAQRGVEVVGGVDGGAFVGTIGVLRRGEASLWHDAAVGAAAADQGILGRVGAGVNDAFNAGVAGALDALIGDEERAAGGKGGRGG